MLPMVNFMFVCCLEILMNCPSHMSDLVFINMVLNSQSSK